MTEHPALITLDEWDRRYAELLSRGIAEPSYGGPISRHVHEGDLRLLRLRYDNSSAALRLWNFLLTEEDRLRSARAEGRKLVGAMKDLGTIPVMAYASPHLTAFYPDGAWWIPCIMELSAASLSVADSLGIDESFCPVRALLGAFLTEAHFPVPDFLTCNVGATCDDFSAIAQRLNGLGYPVLWWESPHRRHPDRDEARVLLPGGFEAPEEQVAFVRGELQRVREALASLAGHEIDDAMLSEGIRVANSIRRVLNRLRRLAYTATPCPMPALEMLIAEMLAIHFCSDRDESLAVLTELFSEVEARVSKGIGVLPDEAIRVFWVNPVADLRVMNILEETGGRICGTEYLFCHALDEIPENIDPMEALARMALADPMTGSARDRAERVCSDIQAFGAEALVISRIPGASHCASEGQIIRQIVQCRFGLPAVEIEVPPICDPIEPTLRTRLEALIETVRENRKEIVRRPTDT